MNNNRRNPNLMKGVVLIVVGVLFATIFYFQFFLSFKQIASSMPDDSESYVATVTYIDVVMTKYNDERRKEYVYDMTLEYTVDNEVYTTAYRTRTSSVITEGEQLTVYVSESNPGDVIAISRSAGILSAESETGSVSDIMGHFKVFGVMWVIIFAGITLAGIIICVRAVVSTKRDRYADDTYNPYQKNDWQDRY